MQIAIHWRHLVFPSELIYLWHFQSEESHPEITTGKGIVSQQEKNILVYRFL